MSRLAVHLDTVPPVKAQGWTLGEGWQTPTRDRQREQSEEPWRGRHERKTGRVSRRVNASRGEVEWGERRKQEPRPRWRPVEPWKGQSREPWIDKQCLRRGSAEGDEKQDGPAPEETLPGEWGRPSSLLTYWQEHRLNGHHRKWRHCHKNKGDGRGSWLDAKTPRTTTSRRDGCKKPWRRERSKFHCTHGNEGHGELLQSSTLDGSGAVRKYRERSIEKWRGAEEGQSIAELQHHCHPRLRTPVPPGLPMEGQTTVRKGPEGDGSNSWTPKVQRKEPPPPPSLKATRARGRRAQT